MAQTDDFVAKAKGRGASDETVLLMLRDSGWSERQARKMLVDHYSAGEAIPSPGRREAVSNPLDAFLYIFASGTLIAWVSATLQLISWQIDLAYGNTGATQWQGRAAAANLATLIVTAPIYLVLMSLLHRRLRSGATGWSSGPRLWVLSGTLLVGVATIVGFLIAAIASLIGGESTLASVLKAAAAIVLVGALLIYYVRWLRGEPHAATP